MTHAATERFNNLAVVFDDHDSEIEIVARDCIGTDFSFIAASYGFVETDEEELISGRDW